MNNLRNFATFFSDCTTNKGQFQIKIFIWYINGNLAKGNVPFEGLVPTFNDISDLLDL